MPEHQNHCADDALLEQLLLGKLHREQAARVEEHVLGCHLCGERLPAIDAKDTLVEAVQAQATLPDWRDDAAAQKLIDSLFRLPMPTQGIASGQATPDENLSELQRFLAPAQSAGELGHIGAYRVLKILGAGGMGIVLEAEDVQLGRCVAIKVMKPRLAASTASKVRFLREARAAAAIQHDNVVTIHQVDNINGLPYLAMQLLSGESLQQRLARQGKLPAAEAVRIGRQIALGLGAAHQQGVVHRDIKPDNIWLEAPNDRVRILDFGLAKVADDDVSLTQSGAVAGTPTYMSPEQAKCESVDHRADLFSLGCVLYRMCTGNTPFSGTTTVTLLLAVTQEEPPPIERLAPEVPVGLSDLVATLLQKDPRRRIQSAAEVVAALEAIDRGAAMQRGMAHSQRRIGRVIALGATATVLLLLALAVWRLARNRGTLVLEVHNSNAAADNGAPRIEPAKYAQSPPPAVEQLACSEATLDWVRNNAKPETASFLIDNLVPFMRKQQQADSGFFFYIAPGLTKSEKMAILAGYNGFFFACPFTAPNGYPPMDSTKIGGNRNDKRSAADAKLFELHIENANDLDPNQEVRGSLKVQALCDKNADYGVRLSWLNLLEVQHVQWMPDKSRGIERIEFRQFPIVELGEHRPVLVFAELVVFPKRDKTDYLIVSDPLPALVRIR